MIQTTAIHNSHSPPATLPRVNSAKDDRLQALKHELHQQIIEAIDLSRIGSLSEQDLRKEIRSAAEDLSRRNSGLLNLAERERLVNEVVDETFGLGPLEPLLHDPTVSDILINGPKIVYVERNGRLELSDVRFSSEKHLLQIIQKIVGRVGRRVDESSPMVDARLEDGSRFNAIISPLALDGSLVSIRRFPNVKSSFDDSTLKKVTDLLQSNVEAKTIAGGVGVVAEKGEVVYFKAVGHQDLAAATPMQKDTLFRIASMTKPITSAAILMLRDDGKLKLSDPVSKYLPEFRTTRVVVREGETPQDASAYQTVPANREITIQDLLTHTSGVTYRFFGQEPFSTLYEKAGVSDGLIETPWTTAENIKRLAGLPLTHQPGEAWQYGLSTDALGRIVEVVSEQSLDDFFRYRIFEPLKMHETHFFVPEQKVPRLATLYRPQKDKSIREVGDAPQSLDGLHWSSTYHWKGPKTYHSGGAGLVSTAGDYLRFLQMLLDGGIAGGRRLLSKESVHEMTTNQIGDLDILFKVHGDKFGYGFGVASQKLPTGAPAGTYSWGGIFHTFFWVDPKNEIIGIVMTQLYPFDHSNLWADFQRLVYEAKTTNNAKQKALGPKPGDVYREFSVHNGGNRDWRVTDPQATAPGANEFLPNPILKLSLSHLEGATRAEAVLDRWGGHLKTTKKRIRFNGQDWIPRTNC